MQYLNKDSLSSPAEIFRRVDHFTVIFGDEIENCILQGM
jgi:hypothetical protein